MKNVFILNLASRTGIAAKVWENLEEYLKENKVEYEAHFTEGPGDATEFARKATSEGAPVNLFVMGGDGTLNEALNGIEDFENTFYCPLPAGSANDFVKGIKLQGTALEILKKALSSDDYKVHDIGVVYADDKKRLFGVSSGIGVDAYVCLQALNSGLKKFLNKIHMGKATYGLLTVGDIFSMPFADAEVIADGEKIKIKNAIFVAAMNCPIEGGGIPMVPYATADSGHLSAFMAHDISRLKCFFALPALVAGKHEKKKGFDFKDFNELEVHMDKPMCLHADGEHVGFFTDVRFVCMPKKLKIKGF